MAGLGTRPSAPGAGEEVASNWGQDRSLTVTAPIWLPSASSFAFACVSLYRGERNMKILKLLLASGLLCAGYSQTQPDVSEIMKQVGQNQTRAEARRREYVYTQKQILRMIRPNGKIAR